MNEVNFLILAEVIEIHRDLIRRYGGQPGVRDFGLLESALAMPQASFAGVYLHPDLFTLPGSACGEIAGSDRHLISAAASGAAAGMAASEYLAREKVRRGEMFTGAVNGKYADEYLALLQKE